MPPALTETQLARAAAAGDGGAFAQLYEQYESRIFNFCLRICGTSEDAADATQDAFVKVLQRLPKLKDSELNFGAYLFTAARNASYDVLGKRKRADSIDEVPEIGATSLMADERATDVREPEKAAMVGALQASVQAANARLPERQREVLALRELEELSYDEIAEIMEMNRNSVAQLISRARINLRDQLRGDALASVAASSEACAKALPLIAMREDGQLGPGADADWLSAHLADCGTCRASVEAMAEAGMSYRAWAPLAVVPWLWKETMARAAELSGSDWQELIDAGRPGQPGSDAGQGAAAQGAARGAGMAGRVALRNLAVAGATALVAAIGVTALVLGDDDPPRDAQTAEQQAAAPGPAPVTAASEPAKPDKAEQDDEAETTTSADDAISTPAITPTTPGQQKKDKAPAKDRPKPTTTPTTQAPAVSSTTTPAAAPTPTAPTPTAPTPATPTVTAASDPCANLEGRLLTACCVSYKYEPASCAAIRPGVVRGRD